MLSAHSLWSRVLYGCKDHLEDHQAPVCRQLQLRGMRGRKKDRQPDGRLQKKKTESQAPENKRKLENGRPEVSRQVVWTTVGKLEMSTVSLTRGGVTSESLVLLKWEHHMEAEWQWCAKQCAHKGNNAPSHYHTQRQLSVQREVNTEQPAAWMRSSGTGHWSSPFFVFQSPCAFSIM